MHEVVRKLPIMAPNPTGTPFKKYSKTGICTTDINMSLTWGTLSKTIIPTI